jgi:hypothetical protein
MNRAIREHRTFKHFGDEPSLADREAIVRLMTQSEPQGGSAPPSPSAVD